MDQIDDTLPPVNDARFEEMLGELEPEEKTMLNEIRRQESPTWLAWIDAAKALLGFDLDGDQEEDGYSLDYAHDAFCAGVAVESYVSGVKARL